MLRAGRFFSSFVANTAGKKRLLINYKAENECLECRTFWMDRLLDLSPELRKGDSLFKADISDVYYHLRFRPVDRMRLLYS